MAFIKSFPSPVGVSVDYWILGAWEYARIENVVRGSLFGFVDESRRRDGKRPAGQLAFEIPIPMDKTPETFGRAEIYEILRSYIFLGDSAPAFIDAQDA